MTLKTDIAAGLALLPAKMDSLPASVLLYATSRQENPRRLPKQVGGPAVSDYQMEEGGGIRGVLNHPASRTQALYVCTERGIASTSDAVYLAMQHDPILAAAFARLLYFTDPKPLPPLGDFEGAWALYLRTWRPGAYKRQPTELKRKWADSYADAMAAYGF